VAETGADITRFPTAAHLCAWAGLAPASYESAGKGSEPGTVRRGCAATLIEAVVRRAARK
jgi:transposase